MSRRASTAAVLTLIALVLVLAAGFSSSEPDGLERVATDLGFAAAAEPATGGPLADYSLAGVAGEPSTFLAGLLGVVVVIALVWLIARVATRRRAGGPESH